MPDIVIPIVFPDYLVTVETPGRTLAIPDLIPKYDLLPDSVKIEPQKKKIPDLGHVGVLFISGASGTTKYYEYGRYGPGGYVRKLPLADVKVQSDGHPAKLGLTYVLSQVSAGAGHSGRIEAAYIEVPGKYQLMLDYCVAREKEKVDPNRVKYDLFTNSCLHFMKAVLDVAKLELPYLVDPRPNSYIAEIRSRYNKLDYSRARNQLVVERPPASLAAALTAFVQPAAA